MHGAGAGAGAEAGEGEPENWKPRAGELESESRRTDPDNPFLSLSILLERER